MKLIFWMKNGCIIYFNFDYMVLNELNEIISHKDGVKYIQSLNEIDRIGFDVKEHADSLLDREMINILKKRLMELKK